MQHSRILQRVSRCGPGQKYGIGTRLLSSEANDTSFSNFVKEVNRPILEAVTAENSEVQAPTPSRTLRASSLGDIAIPSKITPGAAASKDYTPSLKWITRGQSGSSSFAARAALRQRQGQQSQAPSTASTTSDTPASSNTSPPKSSTPRPSLLSRASKRPAQEKPQQSIKQGGTQNESGESKVLFSRASTVLKKRIESQHTKIPTEVQPEVPFGEFIKSSLKNTTVDTPSANTDAIDSQPLKADGADTESVTKRPRAARLNKSAVKSLPKMVETQSDRPLPPNQEIHLRPSEDETKSDRPALPPILELQTTNFEQLFSAPSTSLATTILFRRPTESQGSLRKKLVLEQEGGDYSRYLATRTGTSSSDPLAYAALTLGRRRDVTLKARQKAFEIVKLATQPQSKSGSVAGTSFRRPFIISTLKSATAP
ncbi:hypothetical protein BJ138DRAFT_1108820 [Hygrophoropsis aurantiaca]|uniref:Uncharacterized protein n=1 Tax=Hygrophoropsis aurantiaca TaxID=72124 RepID=A0ACB8AVM5_9AGAM|nr:hypothetical protein BJ138DRAFT_1108820 [Hygrophoropsis aurantiaca]